MSCSEINKDPRYQDTIDEIMKKQDVSRKLAVLIIRNSLMVEPDEGDETYFRKG